MIGCISFQTRWVSEKKFDTETEDDHPWFELDELDFEDSAEAPQIDKSPEEVVDLFLAAKDHWKNELFMFEEPDGSSFFVVLF